MLEPDSLHHRPSHSVYCSVDQLSSLKYTKRQLTIIFLFGLANVVSGTIVGIQAPFYPQEAEDKGATATEYGLVMGAFPLTMFVMALVYKSILGLSTVLYTLGILVTAVCGILFGFLHYIDDRVTFIRLSFLLRILQACGNAGFVTVSLALIFMEFPESIATTFTTFYTCFGLGLVIGPGLGGLLYNLGGFTLPFTIMGCCLVGVSVVTYIFLPQLDGRGVLNREEKEILPQDKTGLVSLIRIPVVSLAIFSVSVSYCSCGFLTATLEPHLRKTFGPSPGTTGMMFMLDGSAYAISAPIWRRLVNKSSQPMAFTFIGALLTFTGFLVIGPAPYIPAETLLWMTSVGLVIHGIGQGASCVSAFIQAMDGAIENGFPDNVATYSLVRAVWMSSIALGAFVGPCVGGTLLDHYGFKMSSVFVLATQIIILFLSSIAMCVSNLIKSSATNFESQSKRSESQNLLTFGNSIQDSGSKSKHQFLDYSTL